MLQKISGILLVFVLLGLAVFCLDAFSGIDEGTVTDPAFSRKTRGDVLFDHERHMEAAGVTDCASCHHMYEDGELLVSESSEGVSCSECHAGKDQDLLPLIEAYHQQCRGCHVEQKSGPVTCAGCHGTP